MSAEEDIIIADDSIGDDLNTMGASDENGISSEQIETLTMISPGDIDIYEASFIGFGVVGSACMMCYGMLAILSLFRKVI